MCLVGDEPVLQNLHGFLGKISTAFCLCHCVALPHINFLEVNRFLEMHWRLTRLHLLGIPCVRREIPAADVVILTIGGFFVVPYRASIEHWSLRLRRMISVWSIRA